MARSRIEIVGDALEHQSDADLAVRAANGDREAFEELYRRHSRTAMRVAYRVTGNIHDASDAVSDAFARVMQALPAGRLAEPTRFRSYLLTATRHAAVDVLRRAGRSVPSDQDAEPAQTTAGPHEVLMDRADNALVAAAFRALPERWRSVLWLTEVEGIPAREAAPMLGVSANGVAQLAVRARAGLRERYLQAHLPAVDGECQEAVSRLGAYVGGAMAVRDLARVDQHLSSCDACRVRETELREIGTTLRRAAVPLPLALGATRLLRRLADAVTAFTHSGGQAVAGGAAAAVFVASVAGVGVVTERQGATVPAAPDAPAAGAAAAAAAPAPPRSATSSQSAAAAVVATTSTTTAPSTTTTSIVVKKTAAAPATTSTTTASPAMPSRTKPAELTRPTASTSTTTTSTTAPPASHRDDEPVVDVPTTLPPVEDVVEDVVDVVEEIIPLELDIDVLAMQSILGAMDEAALVLILAGPDEPLPSPEAPGLPV